MEITKYIIKVWLLSLLIPPLVILSCGNTGFGWYPFLMILSLSVLFSIPVLIAMIVFLNFVSDKWTTFKVKSINSLVGAICVLLIFLMIDSSFFEFQNGKIMVPLSYIIVMTVCIFVFKLKGRENNN